MPQTSTPAASKKILEKNVASPVIKIFPTNSGANNYVQHQLPDLVVRTCGFIYRSIGRFKDWLREQISGSGGQAVISCSATPGALTLL